MKKRIIQLFPVLALAVMVSACKPKKDENVQPETPKAEKANVSFYFDNEAGGQDIELGQMKYTNASGNQYRVDLLKYYISNMGLINSKGDTIKLHNYDLVDASDLASCKIDGKDIPNANYNKLVFYLGVDPGRNHSGAQDGDLDPAKGMIWEWNTGYIFFKHEGKFKNASNADQTLLFHYGTDPALTSVSVPISLTVDGSDKKVYLKFDLNKLYADPSAIDFNINNDHQSDKPGDAAWISTMKGNFPNAFSFDRTE